jgi:hypothetical protein
MRIYPCAYDDCLSEDTLADIVGKWYNSDTGEILEFMVSDYIWDCWEMYDREWELVKEVQSAAEKLDDEELAEMIIAKLDDWGIDALYNNGFKGIEYSSIDFLPGTIRLNLILATPSELNYDFSAISSSYLNPDGTNCKLDVWDNALTWLIEQQGYSMEDVTEMIRADSATSSSKFVNSVYEELYNAYYDVCNAVTILCHCEGQDFFRMMDDLKTAKSNSYKITKDATCGLYEWSSGSGSCLDIQLEKDVVIPAKMIHHIQIEARKPFMTNYGYSVDDVYGLCGSAWSADVTIVENC